MDLKPNAAGRRPHAGCGTSRKQAGETCGDCAFEQDPAFRVGYEMDVGIGRPVAVFIIEKSLAMDSFQDKRGSIGVSLSEWLLSLQQRVTTERTSLFFPWALTGAKAQGAFHAPLRRDWRGG
jgi:hypothetical protein